jgi:hypothetical protein
MVASLLFLPSSKLELPASMELASDSQRSVVRTHINSSRLFSSSMHEYIPWCCFPHSKLATKTVMSVPFRLLLNYPTINTMGPVPGFRNYVNCSSCGCSMLALLEWTFFYGMALLFAFRKKEMWSGMSPSFCSSQRYASALTWLLSLASETQ